MGTVVPQATKDKAVALYVHDQMSLNDIAKKLGISNNTVRKAIIKSGNELRSVSQSLHLKKAPIKDPAEIEKIIDRYKSGEYQHVIAKDYGVNHSVIRMLLIRHAGESVLRSREEVDQERLLVSNEKLKELYKRYTDDESIFVQQLADEFGIKRQTLCAAFSRNNLPLRDPRVAAAAVTRAFTDEQVKTMVHLHKVEGKSLSEIARMFNADYLTLSRSLQVYGGIDIDKSYSEWSKNAVLKYGEELLQKNNGVLPCSADLGNDHRGWVAAIPRHYPGGMRKLRDDLGIDQKISHASELDEATIIDVCELYRHGYTIRDLSLQFSVTLGYISKLLEDAAIPKRQGVTGDCIESVLSKTGAFKIERETYYYIFNINTHPGYLKPGISFDSDHRSSTSYGYYGEELYTKVFANRDEAFFLEEAVLIETSKFADCPEELIGWVGFTEIRKMDLEDLKAAVEYYIEKLEELGKWQFALDYVPMTDKQRDEVRLLSEEA